MEKPTNPNSNPNSQSMGSFPSSPSSQPETPKPETPPFGSVQRSDGPKPAEEQETETLTAGSHRPSEDPKPAKEGEEEEEEEAECGFCLFMKGGGCKDEFVAWEKCVEDAEKSGEDIADKCFDITRKLRVCMDAHADYYEPILRAEKSMAESVSETEPERSDSGAEAGSGAANVQSEKDAAPVSAP